MFKSNLKKSLKCFHKLYVYMHVVKYCFANYFVFIFLKYFFHLLVADIIKEMKYIKFCLCVLEFSLLEELKENVVHLYIQ